MRLRVLMLLCVSQLAAARAPSRPLRPREDRPRYSCTQRCGNTENDCARACRLAGEEMVEACQAVCVKQEKTCEDQCTKTQ